MKISVASIFVFAAMVSAAAVAPVNEPDNLIAREGNSAMASCTANSCPANSYCTAEGYCLDLTPKGGACTRDSACATKKCSSNRCV